MATAPKTIYSTNKVTAQKVRQSYSEDLAMIDLPALSDQELSSSDGQKIWMVRLGEQEFGPYYEDDLKAYAKKHPQLFIDADVCLLPEGEWVMYLQSPLREFSKKNTTKLTSITELNFTREYYYQKDALSQGPVDYPAIKELIEKRELAPTDLVSIDHGASWNKVYHLKELAELCLPQTELPESTLDSEIIQRSQTEALESLMKSKSEDPLAAGLVSLALINQKNSSQQALKISEVEFKSESSSSHVTKLPLSKGGWMLAATAMGFMLWVISWWASSPSTGHGDLSLSESGGKVQRSLFDNPARALYPKSLPAPRRPQVQGSRMPASVAPVNSPAPRPMVQPRQDLVEYRDTHDDPRDFPEPREPMDAVDDPYDADKQFAQDQRDPYQDPRDIPDQRNPYPDTSDNFDDRYPAGQKDDGYRLAPVNSTNPVIEEIGDF
jgi:hypothetical protein